MKDAMRPRGRVASFFVLLLMVTQPIAPGSAFGVADDQRRHNGAGTAM